MALRLFTLFRSDQIPGQESYKNPKWLVVAEAICLKVLGRAFDFDRDFLHAQGGLLEEKGRCNVLIDCDYKNSRPDPKDAVVRFYRVVTVDETTL